MAFPILGLAALAIEAAPTIARWIGGDSAGDVTQKIANTAKAITGHDSPDDAEAALRADPEAYAKFAVAMKQLDADERDAYLADRQNARNRDVEVQKVRGRNTRADVLAFTAIGGLVSLIWLVLFVNIPEGPARDVLLLLGGALITIVKDVYSFEFGSSRGSKDKDNAMASLSKR